MIVFTESPIQTDALLDEVSLPEAGAVVLFLGTTRNLTDGRETDFLDYMCYPEMAKKKLSELEKEAAEKWPILRCAIAHRLGQCLEAPAHHPDDSIQRSAAQGQ